MPIAKCQPLKPTASTKTTLDGSATTAAINRHLKFQDQTKCFFAGSLVGDRDGNNKVHPKEHITFPYFYLLPKVHKVPLPDFKTRPVVSDVSSIMELLSKFLDVQLQRVVHLCPCYLKDSWQFLNDVQNLENLQGYKLITSDANSMCTNINTEYASSILKMDDSTLQRHPRKFFY